MLTNTQKTLVQESFAAVRPIADDAAALFYRRLFELDPSLERMFKGDMAEQRRKLMQMLTAAVKGLDRLEQLVPTRTTTRSVKVVAHLFRRLVSRIPRACHRASGDLFERSGIHRVGCAETRRFALKNPLHGFKSRA